MYKKNCNLANQGSHLPEVVATNFFLKINSPSAGRNSSELALIKLFSVSELFNPITEEAKKLAVEGLVFGLISE